MTEEDITSYTCPECGNNEWYIQNNNCSASTFFNPETTHTECTECGRLDEATTE